MSDSVKKVFETIEEAKAAQTEGKQIFKVTDPGANRVSYVVERSHPLARAAAALAWKIECTVAEPKDRTPQAPLDRAKSAVGKMSEEEKEELKKLLSGNPS